MNKPKPNEKYGRSPAVDAIRLIKQWNNTNQVTRTSTAARMVEDRIRHT